MGIVLTNVWMATLDMRTRHEHRVLDGQRRDVGEPFEVEGLKIRFPGDPEAKPWLVYNCRCTLIPQIKGFEYDIRGDARTDYSDIEGMTYDEWKKNRVEKPNPITLPEEKAEAIRQSYNAEYRRLKKETLAKYGDDESSVRFLRKSNLENEPLANHEKSDIIETKKQNVDSFLPAKTIEEAESYVRQFVDDSIFGATGVSYDGVSLEVANEINHTFYKHYSLFETDKFGGIIAPSSNSKIGKMLADHDATAAYNKVRNSYLLNRKAMKSISYMEDIAKKETEAIKDILANPQNYDFTKIPDRMKRIIENSKVSGRATVPITCEDTMNHEIGHSLQHIVFDSEEWTSIKDNMVIFAPKISGYACDSEDEYIAESFCSYRKGEDLIDPLLRKVFERMKKK